MIHMLKWTIVKNNVILMKKSFVNDGFLVPVIVKTRILDKL